MFEGPAYEQAKRKTWDSHRWEQIMQVPVDPVALRPYTLYCKYCALAAHLVPSGIEVIPDASLSALVEWSLFSLTKRP